MESGTPEELIKQLDLTTKKIGIAWVIDTSQNKTIKPKLRLDNIWDIDVTMSTYNRKDNMQNKIEQSIVKSMDMHLTTSDKVNEVRQDS